MLREVKGGARVAVRRWRSMIALAGMIVTACVILALLLGDVLSQLAVLRGGAELRRQHAVTFSAYYRAGGVSTVGDGVVDDLATRIASGRAYAAVTENVQVDNPDFADGTPTVVLIGDAIGRLYPDLKLCDPAPCAMRGAELAGRQIAPIEFAGLRFDVDGVLPPAATFFDPNAAGLPLGTRILLRLPADRMRGLDEVEREEALTKAVLLAPRDQDVDAFVSRALPGGLTLVPQDVAVDQPRRFRDLMIRSAMYVVGLVAFLGLVLSAFSSAADTTMRQEARTFTLRRMYGAAPHHVAVRIGGFLAMVLLAIPLPLLFLLRLAGDPVAGGALWVIWMIVGTFTALWVTTVRRMVRRDPSGR